MWSTMPTAKKTHDKTATAYAKYKCKYKYFFQNFKIQIQLIEENVFAEFSECAVVLPVGICAGCHRRLDSQNREWAQRIAATPRLDYVQIVKDMSNLRSGTRSSPDWITCWLRDHLLRAVVRYNRRHLLNKPFCTFNKPYRFLHAVVFTAVNFRFK